jgi:hypothetical protein
MAFAFLQDVPISWEVYRHIRSQLGEKPPAGLVVHVVIETENGLRYLDVWESREAHHAFVEEKLHPAVARGLARAGVTRPGEPETRPITVREVWAGSGTV